jgi:hypothetical protein
MKKENIYLWVLLVLFAATTAVGQNSQAPVRRTAAEQAEYEKSVPLNPAKIAPAPAETRMDPAMTQAGPVNWKPAATPAEVRTLPAPGQSANNQVPQKNSVSSGNTQPEGTKPEGATVNRRNVNGPNTQPEATKTTPATSRRDMNGPSTQPEGAKPSR